MRSFHVTKYLPYFLGSWLILIFCPIIHAENVNESSPATSELVWETWQAPESSQTSPEVSLSAASDAQETVEQTVKKSTYAQVRYTEVHPTYPLQGGHIAAPPQTYASPVTYSTQPVVQQDYVQQGYVGNGGTSRTIPDRNPSPEPFPGANYINHLPNTDDHCNTSSCGIAAATVCADPCYDPCVDPCYDPCATVSGYTGPSLFGNVGCIGGTYVPGTLLGDGSMFLTGWINAGATFSPNDNNFPLRYNDRGNEFTMSQLYLSFGKSVNKNRPCFDLGARVDLLYGTDYFYTSALGLETETYRVDSAGNKHPTEYPTNAQLKWNKNNGDRNNGDAALYGLSMPQLYAELFMPIHLGFTAKFGHFYSIMGYESAMAPQNFFYSRTLTTTYGEPATHTGVLFSQQLTQRIALHGGVTRGWDVWDSDSDSVSGLFGVQWETCLGSSLAFSLHTGKTATRSGDTRTNYSLVWVQPLNPALKYVLQHDLGVESNSSYLINGSEEFRSKGTWLSIVQYLECQWTPSLAGGLRFEWFRDDGHSRILQFPTSSVYSNGVAKIEGNNYFNITLGAKWKPREFLTIRPEVRWDWADVKILNTVPGTSGVPGVYDNFSSKNQCTASIDFIVMF